MGKGKHLTSEDLSAYLDEILPAMRRGQLRDHLAACDGCRLEYEVWLTMRQELARLPALLPSSGFVDRVLAALPVEGRQPAPARARPGPGWAALAPAAVLLANVVLLLSVYAVLAGPGLGILVRGLILPGVVVEWCVGLVAALPGGYAASTVAPVAGGLLAGIVLLGLALWLLLRGGALDLSPRRLQV